MDTESTRLTTRYSRVVPTMCTRMGVMAFSAQAFPKIYRGAKDYMERSHISTVVWIDNLMQAGSFFGGLLYLSTDGTVTLLKVISVDWYHVQFVSTDFKHEVCPFLFKIGFTFALLLLIVHI